MPIALLSLIAGALSVLAPCILPLLPIIIGGSFTGKENKWRPYIITGSLVFSLILFTLLLKVSTSLIGIDPKVWNYISGGIVITLGLTMLFPKIWETLISKLGVQVASQKLLGSAGQKKNGTVSAVLTGLALGPVFSSCSPLYGWVIATVLPESTSKGMFYLGMYSLGLAISLLAISIFGRRLIDKIKWASDPKGSFQKVIAILFIAVGLAVITGFDKTIQTYLVDKDFLNLKSLESKLIPGDNSSSNVQKRESKDASYFNIEPYEAPELVGLQEWINSDPLTLKELEGKVVLIDFWTYSCINCERTLPYLQDWYDSYKDDGFVILGLHAPEFAFEKVPKNVRDAVEQRKLTYPIALDNNFTTWKAYENRFWPAHYLIDKNGQVRRVHFGEGEYDETEAAIRALLEEAGATELGSARAAEGEVPPISKEQTPETYLGSLRAERFTNSKLKVGTNKVSISENQPTHTWSLGGIWEIDGERSMCVEDCKLQISYEAKTVYAVLASDTTGTVKIGDKTVNVKADDIYTLVDNDKVKKDTIILEFSPGVAIHAFTFGS